MSPVKLQASNYYFYRAWISVGLRPSFTEDLLTYHEKLFIQVVNDISSQVFLTSFFQPQMSWRLSEAVFVYGMKVA